jgi:hypothetical protein
MIGQGNSFRRRTLGSLGAVLLLVAAMAPAAAAGAQRPFLGKYSGLGVAVTQRCGPAALTIGHQISGVATHLGRFSGSGSNCTEFTLATDSVAIWDGQIDLIAADGSTLSGASEGSQAAPANGVAAYSQTMTITSGTGRFEDASGLLIITGTINFTTFAASGEVTGWLSY